MLGSQFPKIETMLRDAGPGITAFADSLSRNGNDLVYQSTRAPE